MAGIIFDAIDGPLARKLDAHSVLGAHLDSSADYVSFGVTPAVIIFQLFNHGGLILPGVGAFLALSYYFSVRHRLKRFGTTGHSDYFEGLPSPAGAAVVLLIGISHYLQPIIVAGALVIAIDFLMLSRIPYAHLTIATRQRFYQVMCLICFIFTVLTVLKFLNNPFARNIFAYEILFGLVCVYVLSPVGSVFKRVTD
jgi:CDP-diacylglycerol--serine O-phosphatidyltransferase